MRNLIRLMFLGVVLGSLTSCLFKEPVFTGNFLKTDPALVGVWAAEDEKNNPRKTDFAVCLAQENDRYFVNYPAGMKEGLYYEARLVKVREHNLLQICLLATFNEGLAKPESERYTVLWIEKDPSGQTVQVRALNGDSLKEKSPAEAKKALEDPAGDWNKLFGKPMTFHRLKDE